MTTFEHPVRVYYEDTDAGGVVYHANYLKFMARARSEWLRSLGHELDVLAEQGILFVVSEANVKYLKGARFNAELVVSSSLNEARRASLHFSQRVCDAHDTNKVYCQADIKVVSVDKHFKPCPLPFKWPTEVSESPKHN